MPFFGARHCQKFTATAYIHTCICICRLVARFVVIAITWEHIVFTVRPYGIHTDIVVAPRKRKLHTKKASRSETLDKVERVLCFVASECVLSSVAVNLRFLVHFGWEKSRVAFVRSFAALSFIPVVWRAILAYRCVRMLVSHAYKVASRRYPC